MAKIMRIVEPHMYEEFLAYLQRPECTCVSHDKPTEEKPTFTITTVSDVSKDNAAHELIPSGGDQTMKSCSEKATVGTEDTQTSLPVTTKNEEAKEERNTKSTRGGGPPRNWLNIETLHIRPYSKRYAASKRKVKKGGKRR